MFIPFFIKLIINISFFNYFRFMNRIIESSILTLQKAKNILSKISNDELSDSSVSPYYSSVGSHIRHVCDFYKCSLNINDEGKVDLTLRERDLSVEICCDSATKYVNNIIDKLFIFEQNSKDSVIVIDDFGSGNIEIDYTYAALLSQANSHTIHHYAIIGYILDRLNIEIDDLDFGYNPTTPNNTIKIS